MYLVLLVFGLVLTAAGTGLAASGVSLHDRIFDMTVVTPGIVAAIGGLLLIGLGLALRVLQRIERALAARPMPRVARPGETLEPNLASERPSEARIPFPAKANSRPQSAPVAAVAPPAHADGRQPEDLAEKQPAKLPEKPPALARSESTKIDEETDSPLSPRAPSNVDEAVGEVASGRLTRRSNGGVPARITPRLDMSVRSPLTTERPKGPAFDALWPKGQRPARPAQSAPAQAAATPVPATPMPPAPVSAAPAVEPEQSIEPVRDIPEAVGTVAADEGAVSVLKSGVVDGMAYTLFSDGSIEAELPQGTLRFGSITELRNHIEQSA
jgi:hypothetical protein